MIIFMSEVGQNVSQQFTGSLICSDVKFPSSQPIQEVCSKKKCLHSVPDGELGKIGLKVCSLENRSSGFTSNPIVVVLLNKD